eukprot:GHVU01068223.1.p2 GENE.GHVU01068223.1~~GHVU01068223.1.p2  ORF type:complete len:119 (+),score=18.67 GHVU01068223.1:644-1000(+)
MPQPATGSSASLAKRSDVCANFEELLRKAKEIRTVYIQSFQLDRLARFDGSNEQFFTALSSESRKPQPETPGSKLQGALEVFEALSRYEKQMKTDFTTEMLKKLKGYRKKVSKMISEA